MPFPGYYPITGTEDVALDTANTGFDSFAGAGTAVYKDGGLATGSVSHALITGQRNGRSITTSAAAVWTEMWFRQPDEEPPIGADAIIVRNYDAADANLSGVQIAEDSKIKLLAGRDPEANIVESKRDYADGNTWRIQHWDIRSWTAGTWEGDDAWDTLPRQFLYIFNKRGKLVEFMLGDADAGTHDRNAVGITNTGPTFAVEIDEIRVQATRMYSLSNARLDRFRWVSTPTGIAAMAQVQGVPYVRLTTPSIAPTASVLASHLGNARFDEVALSATASHAITVQGSLDDTAWTSLGDAVSTTTVAT